MVNYSVNFILRKVQANPLGHYPVYLRITISRKTVYMATGHFIPERLWNAKTETVREAHPESKNLNIDLAHRKNEVKQKIVELQVSGKDISAKMVKEQFKGGDLTNIFDFIDSLCLEVKHKKDDLTIQIYERHGRKLQAFYGSRNLSFEEITPAMLGRFEKYLRDKGASNNYVFGIFKTIKTFFNVAKRKGLTTNYPFNQYENPVYVDPEKDYLNLDELKELESFADTTTNKVWKQTAVYFLFGCYSGLRISDWKKFDIKTHVSNDTVNLRATKNGEWVSIPFSGPLARNIERMKALPLKIEEPTLNEKIKIIAGKLGIKKHLSSHCARKTFAVTMCADQGISSETCATLMGITVEICVRNYYRVTDHKIKTEVLKAWSGL
jgi:site-specific recombinase XerD